VLLAIWTHTRTVRPSLQMIPSEVLFGVMGTTEMRAQADGIQR